MNRLKRLLPSQDIDALLGDITEERRHRSRPWYWGQIAALIIVGSFREIRRHPLLTLRATAVGFVALAAYVSLWVGLLYGLQQFAYTFPDVFSFNQIGDVAKRSIIAGVWLTFLAGFSLCGWIAGLLHRRHGIALVLPFAGLAGLAVIKLLAPRPTDSALIVAVRLIHFVSIPAAILVGGYWSTRKARMT
jgi:hypothetical protein